CGGRTNVLRTRGATHARPPFGIVAEFAFLEPNARVWNTERLLDLQKVLELRGSEGLQRLPELRRDPNRAAVGLEDFHFEIGVLHIVVAPGHRAVIAHENGVVLLNEVRDELAHLRRAGRAVRRERDTANEDLNLGNHATRRLNTGNRESSSVRRMTMHGGDRARLALHDLQVHQNFTGTLFVTAELVTLKVDQA